jgi:hypothetical protein
MRKNLKIILVFVFVTLFAGLSFYLKRPSVLLKKYELDINDKTELIQQLENKDYQGNVRASISDQSIYLNIDGKALEIDIESEDLYIAFAPYISTTHDCYTHSLTGCRGELIDREVTVKIYDEFDELLLEEVYNTGRDGFIGLFLTKGNYYRVEASYDGKLSSFEVIENTSQTCYTEVELR